MTSEVACRTLTQCSRRRACWPGFSWELSWLERAFAMYGAPRVAHVVWAVAIVAAPPPRSWWVARRLARGDVGGD
jgi:hypothetical protein